MIEIWVFLAVLIAAVALAFVVVRSRPKGQAPPGDPAARAGSSTASPTTTATGDEAAAERQAPPAPAARGLADRIRSLFGAGGPGEDTWKSLEEALIRADVGPKAAGEIVSRVRDAYTSSADPAELVVDEVAALFDGDTGWSAPTGHPGIVMVVGVNGTGKTTTIGKLARRLRTSGLSVGMAASDTFRAAASEQLGTWAERTGAHLVAQERGADPGAVAFDAVKAAHARGLDVLIVDTAGRLHTRTPLMEELKKVRRVLEKAAGLPPDEVLLVLDATTGQNGIQQARAFTEAVDVTGVVLTKMDGTARGGIVCAVREELGVPVKLVGTGEGIDDLSEFDPKAFARGLVS